MEHMSVENLATLLSSGGIGVVSGLLLILIGNLKGTWVSGREFNSKVKECEDWKQVAIRNSNIAQTVVQK